MFSWLFRLFRRRELDCGEVRAAASDFIDGDLASDMAGRVRSHLSGCVPCSMFVETLRTTMDMLRSLTPSAAPPGFRERVLERIAQEGRP